PRAARIASTPAARASTSAGNRRRQQNGTDMASVSPSEPSTTGVDPAWPDGSHHHGTSGSPQASSTAAMPRATLGGRPRSGQAGTRMIRQYDHSAPSRPDRPPPTCPGRLALSRPGRLAPSSRDRVGGVVGPEPALGGVVGPEPALGAVVGPEPAVR